MMTILRFLSLRRPPGATAAAACAVALSALLFSGCRHKGLVYGDEDSMWPVDIRFDWRYAPEACPDGMTVRFYPAGNSPDTGAWHYEIAGREGGRVSVPCGRYTVVAYNNDTRRDRILDTQSLTTLHAVTIPSPAEPWAESGGKPPDEPVRYQSDRLWRAICGEVTVTPCGVTWSGNAEYADDTDIQHTGCCGESVLVCYPVAVTTVYTCLLSETVNLSSVAHMDAMLTGPAEGVCLWNDLPFGKPVAVPFDVAPTDATTVSGSLRSFGYDGPSGTLTIYSRLYDGTSRTIECDVSGQLENQQGQHDVLILIKGLSFPEIAPGDTIISGGGTITVDVGSWETVVIDQYGNIEI